MRPRSLSEIASAVNGRLAGTAPSGGRAAVRTVEVDSRRAGPGTLFVALPGERADGHAFVGDALARGAAAALVRDGADVPGAPADARLVVVRDPGRALLDLARLERGSQRATVVGITGSTGKTCTKDLIAAVLGSRLKVIASAASFNNEVGLPLTVLRADEDTEALVCEMGSRGPGHIRLLCEVARPDVGVLTNVGVAHMELFGSPEILREAKAELVECLPPDGTAVLNADDPVVRGYAARTPARVVWYSGGHSETASEGGAGESGGSAPMVVARNVRLLRKTGSARFLLATPSGEAEVSLAVPGEHMVPNALAAAAVGWALGLDTAEIAGALETARVSDGRMQLVETSDGLRIIDDAYNANPTSMAAALRAARWMAGEGRCIAVLGPMAELGPISSEEHERVGELAARLGLDHLVVVGREARLLAVGAEREGVEPERISLVEDVEGAVEAVRSMARPGDLVLVKASRVARLERVVRALLEPASPNGAGT